MDKASQKTMEEDKSHSKPQIKRQNIESELHKSRNRQIKNPFRSQRRRKKKSEQTT